MSYITGTCEWDVNKSSVYRVISRMRYAVFPFSLHWVHLALTMRAGYYSRDCARAEGSVRTPCID